MKSVRILLFSIVICILILLSSGTDKGRFFMNNPAGGAEPGSVPPVATFSIVAFDPNTKELGSRLISTLEADQAAGGDKQGRQSAALLIVHEGWGYDGFNDRYRDLRVDDHPEPIQELRRIHEIHKKVFPQPKAGNSKD